MWDVTHLFIWKIRLAVVLSQCIDQLWSATTTTDHFPLYLLQLTARS